MRGLAAAAALATIVAPAYAGSSSDAAKPVAVAVRLTQDAGGARLIFDVSQPVEARAYALYSPDRIVVDLPEVAFELDPSVGRISVNDDALVKAFRFGPLTAGRSRIIIDLARPACPREVLTKPIVEGAPASRLLIELKPCDFLRLRRPTTSAGRAGCRKPRRSAVRLAASYRSRPGARRRGRRRAWRRRRLGKDAGFRVLRRTQTATRRNPQLQGDNDARGR